MSDKPKSKRPLPRPNAYMETEPFWAATRDGKMMLQYCLDSGRYQWQPRPVSIFTGKRNLEWREASGKATLYSWTEALAPWPGHEDRVPYMCATVELAEGVRIVTNLVNFDPKDLRDGMPLKLTWDQLSDDFAFPVFEPA
jgi:uncharacterized OB-fold protein